MTCVRSGQHPEPPLRTLAWCQGLCQLAGSGGTTARANRPGLHRPVSRLRAMQRMGAPKACVRGERPCGREAGSSESGPRPCGKGRVSSAARVLAPRPHAGWRGCRARARRGRARARRVHASVRPGYARAPVARARPRSRTGCREVAPRGRWPAQWRGRWANGGRPPG